ncbi:MAG: hypothetical protein KBH07_05770 [Flavobacteriales bacterium]|nr:hypothetical protein [Flavobacteriales bacterium]MBP9080351.1 hypothetical protein [Flavobacteriales bacterium]
MLVPFAMVAQQRAGTPALDLSGSRIQLIGTVTDSLTGKPVYDCLVGYYDQRGERRMVTPVNSDGQFALFIPPHSPFELRIEQENGYRDLHTSVEVIPEGLPQMRIDLVLQPR